MDISDIITTEYESIDADARVAELVGLFREAEAKAAVVTDDGEYLGVVTQAKLNESQRDENEKVRNVVWNVARVGADADVRAVARLMVGSSSQLLPVFDDDEFVGVVRARALLGAVQEYLDVLTVDDVCTYDLQSVSSTTTLGEVLHALREQRITHLPVVDGDDAVGVVSVFDLIGFTTREMQRSTGGTPASTMQTGGGRSHGGFGERAGDVERMLDLPVEQVMTRPVVTTAPGASLEDATRRMLESDISSLLVVDDGAPVGIVTRTDVLRALTVTDETALPVQITNVDLLDDITRDEVAAMLEDVVGKYADLTVLEANVYLHEHDETLRGTPLIMARIRLFTDRGHFVGTGEGYGATHALHLARNTVERQLLEGKEYGRTKKHPSEETWEKVFGWYLDGTSRAT